MASNAQGCDRHLLGLKLLRKEGEKPDIFEDPVFGRSCSWTLSTSTLNCEHFLNWGFGEVVPGGLGIGYMAHKKQLTMTISSLTTLNPGSAEFCRLLRETLHEQGWAFRPARDGGDLQGRSRPTVEAARAALRALPTVGPARDGGDLQGRSRPTVEAARAALRALPT
eukprot:gene18927-12987_t